MRFKVTKRNLMQGYAPSGRLGFHFRKLKDFRFTKSSVKVELFRFGIPISSEGYSYNILPWWYPFFLPLPANVNIEIPNHLFTIH